MENLPLEEIFFCLDSKSLGNCRLVSEKWYENATRIWQNLEATRVKINSVKDIDLFLATFNGCDFCSYKKFTINILSIYELMRLTAKYGSSINDLQITSSTPANAEHINQFLMCLGSSSIPNLTKLSTQFLGNADFPITTFQNLRELSLTSSIFPSRKTLESFFQAAPNLQVLEVNNFHCDLAENNTTDLLPFTEECKRIPKLKIRACVLRFGDGCLTRLMGFTKALVKWPNVAILRLNISAASTWNSDFESANESKMYLTRILEIQTKFIEFLYFEGLYDNPKIFNEFELPMMQKLSTLNIGLTYKAPRPLATISSRSVPRLREIQIRFWTPAPSFSSEVLKTVKTLRIIQNGFPVQLHQSNCTEFDDLLPNLEDFSYINWSTDAPNLDLVQYFVSNIRMKSVKSLKYHLRKHGDRPVPLEEGDIARIVAIFSGFDNIGKVVEDGELATESGEIYETEYWGLIEQLRKPSLVGITGLKSLEFDFPVSEDFVEAVLLKMPPLDTLSLISDGSSEHHLNKLRTRHKSIKFAFV